MITINTNKTDYTCIISH